MIAAELVKPLDFGRAFEENVGVISLRTAFLCLAAVLAGLAQQPGPALSVDANAGRHAISPDICGINQGLFLRVSRLRHGLEVHRLEPGTPSASATPA